MNESTRVMLKIVAVILLGSIGVTILVIINYTLIAAFISLGLSLYVITLCQRWWFYRTLITHIKTELDNFKVKEQQLIKELNKDSVL